MDLASMVIFCDFVKSLRFLYFAIQSLIFILENFVRIFKLKVCKVSQNFFTKNLVIIVKAIQKLYYLFSFSAVNLTLQNINQFKHSNIRTDI